MQPTTTVLLLAGLTATLSGQVTNVVVPASAAAFDGNHKSDLPFVYDKFRAQQIWEGKSIASTSATINAMGWRRDTGDNTPYALTGVRLLTNFNVSIGYSTVPPDRMSPTYSTNIVGQLTNVFSGPLQLPPQPSAIVQAPWSIVIPFTAPFSYTPSQGHLLVEWTEPGVAMSKDRYPLDAQYWGAAGSVTQFGTGGLFSGSNLPLRVYYNPTVTPASNIVPGGAFELRIYQMPSAVPTVGMFGLSSVLSPAGPLPIDLSLFGAPGNSLYCSLDATTPTLTPQLSANGRYAVHVNVPIPNLPTLAGARFFNQAVCLSAAANTLGAVFSNAQQVLIGAIIARPETNMIYSSDTTRPDGFFLYGNNSQGGLVTVFQGTFQ